MPETPYHEWNLPVVGGDADAWGEKLNAVFEALDLEVIEKGPTTGTPPVPSTDPGNAGRWYLATDTVDPRSRNDTALPYLYYDDGSSWITIWDGDAKTLAGEEAGAFLRANGSVPMQAALSMAGYSVSGAGSIVFEDADGDGSAWTLREGTSGSLEILHGGSVMAYVTASGILYVDDGDATADRSATRVWVENSATAADSARLGGIQPGNWARTDVQPTFSQGAAFNYKALAEVGNLGMSGDIAAYHDNGSTTVTIYDYSERRVPAETVEHIRTYHFQAQTVPQGDYAAGRRHIDVGETIRVHALGVQTAGGSISGDLPVVVRDVGAGTDLVSATSKREDYSTAPVTASGATDIEFRLENNGSGGELDLTAFVDYSVV